MPTTHLSIEYPGDKLWLGDHILGDTLYTKVTSSLHKHVLGALDVDLRHHHLQLHPLAHLGGGGDLALIPP